MKTRAALQSRNRVSTSSPATCLSLRIEDNDDGVLRRQHGIDTGCAGQRAWGVPIKSRHFSVLTAVGTMLFCIVAQPARAVETVPFTDPKGLVQVQGSVDGQPPVPMLVDLGAGVDVLSSDLGRRYVLVNGKYVSLRLSGERVDLPIGKVLTLTMGGVRVDAPRVGIARVSTAPASTD